MDPLETVDNPDLIPGIFNYCDRWCERCAFTSRCANFATSESHFKTPGERDIHNEQFWEKLHEVFQQTRAMIEEFIEEEGIEITEEDLEAAAEEEERLTEAAESHDCVRGAEDYATSVNTWFEAASGLFEEKNDSLNLQASADLDGVDPYGDAAELSDAVDVIRWYQYQIMIKLTRAVRGSLEDPPEDLEEYPSDAVGSAKIALIGLDRSLAAWGCLHNHFVDREDEILDILISIDRLRRQAETAFPDARAFARPGFDD